MVKHLTFSNHHHPEYYYTQPNDVIYVPFDGARYFALPFYRYFVAGYFYIIVWLMIYGIEVKNKRDEIKNYIGILFFLVSCYTKNVDCYRTKMPTYEQGSYQLYKLRVNDELG